MIFEAECTCGTGLTLKIGHVVFLRVITVIFNLKILRTFLFQKAKSRLQRHFSLLVCPGISIIVTTNGASDKESACQCRRHKRPGFGPWVRKIPWIRKWQPTAAFLPEKFLGQRSLQDYSSLDCRVGHN